MKEGIHLGPPLPRLASLGWAAALVLGLAGLALGALTYRAEASLSAAREEVSRLEGFTGEEPPVSSARLRSPAGRLQSILDSGALANPSPTEVLRMVGSALPDGVFIVQLTASVSAPNRSVTFEASARDALAVTELQRRVSASPLVARTTVLEERRLPDGSLSVRLQADLRDASSP